MSASTLFSYMRLSNTFKMSFRSACKEDNSVNRELSLSKVKLAYQRRWVELQRLVENVKSLRLKKILVEVVFVPHGCYDNHLSTDASYLLKKVEKHCNVKGGRSIHTHTHKSGPDLSTALSI